MLLLPDGLTLAQMTPPLGSQEGSEAGGWEGTGLDKGWHLDSPTLGDQHREQALLG